MHERRTILASGGGAVGLSLFASLIGLCCVGPWTVALLGVSGAIGMARWQPYRPFILMVAGAILANLSAPSHVPNEGLRGQQAWARDAHCTVVFGSPSAGGAVCSAAPGAVS